MKTLSARTGTLIGVISKEEADEMVKSYAAPDNQTKCVWFSLEEMDQMVTILKTEKMYGWDTDGVRIYFGTYTTGTIGTQPKNYLGLNTLIMVSTMAVKSEAGEVLYHEDYFDHIQVIPEPGDKAIISDPQNRGELCQPNCSGATLPTS